MDELTKAYAWQEALELSKQLVQVCEEFSDADTNVLVWHLRQAVVEIPATIAADLEAGRAATMEPVTKLMAELVLVHAIYPAIETGDAEELLEGLRSRMQSDRFGERQSEPEPEVEPQPASEVVVVPQEENAAVTTSADPNQSDDHPQEG